MAARRERKPVVWLVHPDPAEAGVREKELTKSGYRVIRRHWSSPEISRARADPPDAVVIDLSRAPSIGRDVAVAMRSHRALLSVPFLLVGGNPDAVAGVRKFLPDATACEWTIIKASVSVAMKKQPPGARLLSVFSAYEGVPLAKKARNQRGRHRCLARCAARIAREAR